MTGGILPLEQVQKFEAMCIRNSKTKIKNVFGFGYIEALSIYCRNKY